jgi:glutathione S-transferase
VTVKLHRCGLTWLKIDGHPCWRVQKALDEAGVQYDVVTGPLSRKKRTETQQKTGQNAYPWLELEDGTVIREESKVLAERIRTGGLGPPTPAI